MLPKRKGRGFFVYIQFFIKDIWRLLEVRKRNQRQDNSEWIIDNIQCASTNQYKRVKSGGVVLYLPFSLAMS